MALITLYGHKEIFVNSSLKVTKKKKIGYCPLKNEGERSRSILALLSLFSSYFLSSSVRVSLIIVHLVCHLHNFNAFCLDLFKTLSS